MSVLTKGALQDSPLADLHLIASELSIDSYRRLRRAELIDAILQRQSGGKVSAEAGSDPDAAVEPAPRRRRRGGRSRQEPPEAPPSDEAAAPDHAASEQSGADGQAEPEVVEGLVELLPGGSGFVRIHPPEPSDEDIYISSAQVKRCELVTGDRVSGPRRPPRRSERFASLVRVDTVNGRPASELADGMRFDELPLAFPDQRLELGAKDPALEPIDSAAPIGRGSRALIVGPSGAGKTELLRRVAAVLAEVEGLKPWLALVGVRPEEIPEWRDGPISPAVSLSFGASGEAQGQALEGVVEQVRRLVARGADAIVLIDTLDRVGDTVASKVLASARNVVDGGSLTVIATASKPLGGETSLIVIDRAPQGVPEVDAARSWTIRRERLV